MNNKQYIENMKMYNKAFLKFIQTDDDCERYFQNLLKLFNDHHVKDNKHVLKSILHLILYVSNYHHRCPNFFDKIQRLLIILKDNIKLYFSNTQIFNIFKSNKKLLLFLFEENILIKNDNILWKISNEFKDKNYISYLYPEINNDYDIFNEKQSIGENDSYICELIREDLIKEFVSYVNINNILLSSQINESIFETNPFLLQQKTISLIEYACYFGSIQIFNYLRINNVQMTSSLWIYAIHSNNPDLIHLLEENKVEKNNKLCIKESIKCHHNALVEYFINNEDTEISYLQYGLKYYNFRYVDSDLINPSNFYHICKYDHFILAEALFRKGNIDVNYIAKPKTNSKFTLFDQKSLLFSVSKKANVEILYLLLLSPTIKVNHISNIFEDCIYQIDENNFDKTFECKDLTALHIAVEKGHEEIVKLLMSDIRCDVNILAKSIKMTPIHRTEEKTALYIAIEKENIEVIKLLLSNKNLKFDFLFRSSVWTGEQAEPIPYDIVDEINITNFENVNKNSDIAKLMNKYITK